MTQRHRRRRRKRHMRGVLRRNFAILLVATMLLTASGVKSVSALGQGEAEQRQVQTEETQSGQPELMQTDVDLAESAAVSLSEEESAGEQNVTGQPGENPTGESETAEGSAPSEQSQEKQGTDAQTVQETADTGELPDDQGETTPQAVALSTLEASLEDARNRASEGNTIGIKQYADESITVNLRDQAAADLTFGGGVLNEGDTEEIPDYASAADEPARTFVRAAFVYLDAPENPVWLTGLYPYPKNDGTGYDWYYTTEKTDEDGSGTETEGPLGSVEVGYLLPENVEIRFYYGLTAEDTYTVTLSAEASFALSLTGGELSADGNTFTAKAGARVIGTLNMGNTLKWTEASLQGSSEVLRRWGFFRAADDMKGDQPPEYTDPDYTHAERLNDSGNYQFEFTMPDQEVTLSVTGHQWEGEDSVSWFGIGTTETSNKSDAGELGATRIYTYSKSSNSNTTSNVSQLSYTGGGANNGFGSWAGGARPLLSYEFYDASDYKAATKTRTIMAGNIKASSNAQPNIGPGTSGKGLWPAVLNPDTGATVNIPVGEFVPGGTVVFGLEGSRGRQNRGWYGKAWIYKYIPATISVDIYNQESFSSTDFERYTVNMPKNAGESVTENFPGGGSITIECKYANSTEAKDLYGTRLNNYYNVPANDGSQPLWYTYKITVSGIISDFKIVYDSYSTVQNDYYVHELDGTVEGEVVSGRDISDPSRVSGDFIYYSKGRTINSGNLVNRGTLGYYPLREGLKINTSERATDSTSASDNTNWIRLGAQVQEGYSKPAITLETTGTSNINVTEESRLADGRYVYKVELRNSSRNNEQLPSGRLNMVSEPVSFPVKYYTSESEEYKVSDTVLRYDGSENYIIQPYLPGGITALKGYSLEVWTAGEGSEAEKVAVIPYNKLVTENTAESETLWLPGSVINVRDLYLYLQSHDAEGNEDSNGALKMGVTTYDIRLIPQSAASGESTWLVGGIRYTTYQQTGWFEDWNDDPATGVTEEFAAQYFSDKATREIDGYLNSAIVFSNYPEFFEDPQTGERYALARDKSITSGVSTGAEGEILGHFYYLNQADVRLGVPDYLKSENLDPRYQTTVATQLNRLREWVEVDTELYTGAAGRDDNIFQLPAAGSTSGFTSMPATIITSDGITMKWDGWKFGELDEQGNLTKIYDYEIDPNASSVDLYSMYSESDEGKEAWEGIFGTGAGASRQRAQGIVLVPTYSGVRISSAGESSYSVTTYTGGDPDMNINNGSFKISADFTFSGTEDNLMREGISFAVTKGENTVVASGVLQNNTAQYLKGSYASSGKIVSDGISCDVSGQTFTIQFDIRSIVGTDGKPSINYGEEDGKSYRIYAWSTGNNLTVPNYGPTGPKLSAEDGIDGNELAWLKITPGTSSADIYSDTNSVNVLPKKVTSHMSTGGGHEPTGVAGIAHSTMPEENAEVNHELKLTATFLTDQYWYGSGVNVTEEDKKATPLKAALYIRDYPSEESAGTWSLMATENGAVSGAADGTAITPDKITGPTIQCGAGGVTTVTFTLSGVPSEDFQYSIALWNDMNTDGRIEATEFDPDDPNQDGEGVYTVYAKIPSLTKVIKPDWHEDASVYVLVPQEIILTESEANLGTDVDTTGYAGHSGTLEYVKTNSEGQTVNDWPKIRVTTTKQLYISNSNNPSEFFPVTVYDKDGKLLTEPDPERPTDHIVLGTMNDDSEENKTITYWLNAEIPSNVEHGSQYWGKMTYHFTNLEANTGNEEGGGSTQAG